MQSKLQVQLKGKENLGDFFMTGGGMPVGAVACVLSRPYYSRQENKGYSDLNGALVV